MYNACIHPFTSAKQDDFTSFLRGETWSYNSEIIIYIVCHY